MQAFFTSLADPSSSYCYCYNDYYCDDDDYYYYYCHYSHYYCCCCYCRCCYCYCFYYYDYCHHHYYHCYHSESSTGSSSRRWQKQHSSGSTHKCPLKGSL